MPSRRLSLVAALALFASLLGGVAAADAPRVVYGKITGTVYDGGGPNPCTVPFDATHVVWVDVWDASRNRFYDAGSFSVDGTGTYSVSDLDAGDYRVRFRVFDAASELVEYRWHHDSATARRFEDAQWVSVGWGQTVQVNPCLSGFTGGTFKGTVTSSQPGFDPTCTGVMAYEGTSGVLIGWLDTAGAAGRYRYTQLPPGQYKALALASKESGCPDPPEVLDQWRKGISGPGLYSNAGPADHFDTAGTFTVTAGATTAGVHFDMVPIGTCDGKVPTILGTTGPDVIIGTAGPDVIKAFDGDDEIHGGGGKDVICGGPGHDVIFGGARHDRIFGEAGNDYLDGGDGPDMLRGGLGADELLGGPGNDLLRGDLGDDRLYGEGGNDRLRGNKGDDTLDGGDGDDHLDGGPGFDVGDGGAGLDVCTTATEITANC